MPSTHRIYDKEFRQDAVNLLLSSGRPLKRVAAELGVTANSLRTWRDRALGKGRLTQAASGEDHYYAEPVTSLSQVPRRSRVPIDKTQQAGEHYPVK